MFRLACLLPLLIACGGKTVLEPATPEPGQAAAAVRRRPAECPDAPAAGTRGPERRQPPIDLPRQAAQLVISDAFWYSDQRPRSQRHQLMDAAEMVQVRKQTRAQLRANGWACVNERGMKLVGPDFQRVEFHIRSAPLIMVECDGDCEAVHVAFGGQFYQLTYFGDRLPFPAWVPRRNFGGPTVVGIQKEDKLNHPERVTSSCHETTYLVVSGWAAAGDVTGSRCFEE